MEKNSGIKRHKSQQSSRLGNITPTSTQPRCKTILPSNPFNYQNVQVSAYRLVFSEKTSIKEPSILVYGLVSDNLK